MVQGRYGSPRKGGRKRHRRRRYGIIYKLMTFVIVVAVMIYALTFFFRINEIEVVGNEKYSAKQVSAASGFKVGDNLLILDKASGEEKIKEELTYVRDVSFKRGLPDTLIIELVEARVAGYVSLKNGNWLIDTKGRVLESVPVSALGGYAEIVGLGALGPIIGAEIGVEEGMESRKAALIAVLGEFGGLLDKTTRIDLTRDDNVKMFYDGRLEIRLGVPTDLEKKWESLDAVMKESLPINEKAVVDLSDGKYVRVVPVQ